MIINKITTTVDYDYWLKDEMIGHQLNEPTYQNSIPKLLSQLIRKGKYKTLGTCILNVRMSHPSHCGTRLGRKII